MSGFPPCAARTSPPRDAHTTTTSTTGGAKVGIPSRRFLTNGRSALRPREERVHADLATDGRGPVRDPDVRASQVAAQQAGRPSATEPGCRRPAYQCGPRCRRRPYRPRRGAAARRRGPRRTGRYRRACARGVDDPEPQCTRFEHLAVTQGSSAGGALAVKPKIAAPLPAGVVMPAASASCTSSERRSRRLRRPPHRGGRSARASAAPRQPGPPRWPQATVSVATGIE
jgi:hypothetical protein